MSPREDKLRFKRKDREERSHREERSRGKEKSGRIERGEFSTRNRGQVQEDKREKLSSDPSRSSNRTLSIIKEEPNPKVRKILREMVKNNGIKEIDTGTKKKAVFIGPELKGRDKGVLTRGLTLNEYNNIKNATDDYSEIIPQKDPNSSYEDNILIESVKPQLKTGLYSVSDGEKLGHYPARLKYAPNFGVTKDRIFKPSLDPKHYKEHWRLSPLDPSQKEKARIGVSIGINKENFKEDKGLDKFRKKSSSLDSSERKEYKKSKKNSSGIYGAESERGLKNFIHHDSYGIDDSNIKNMKEKAYRNILRDREVFGKDPILKKDVNFLEHIKEITRDDFLRNYPKQSEKKVVYASRKGTGHDGKDRETFFYKTQLKPRYNNNPGYKYDINGLNSPRSSMSSIETIRSPMSERKEETIPQSQGAIKSNSQAFSGYPMSHGGIVSRPSSKRNRPK